MRLLILITSIAWLMVPTAFAATGGTHGDTHIPWGMVGQQIFNLSIVIFALWFLLRKKVATYFSDRKQKFNQLIQKAEEAKVSAEKSKREISERLHKLESQSQETLKEAKSEAEELKSKITKEAKALSEKLEDDALKSAEFEVERAKLQLRSELLKNSIAQSRESLNSEMDTSDQQGLNKQFIEKLQVTQ